MRPVGRAAERLGVTAVVAGTVLWSAAARTGAGRVGLAVMGVLLALPPLALGAFAIAVRALLALPRRLREAPSALRARTETIRGRAEELAAARRRGPLHGLRATVRLWWAVASSRDVLEVVGPAALLLSPTTVVLAALGAGGAVLEILAGAAALVWLALT